MVWTNSPKPGSYGVVHYRGPWRHNPVAAAIRFFTNSQYSHAFIVCGQGKIVEAHAAGAAVDSLEKYRKEDVLFSTVPLTDRQRVDIVAAANTLVGTKYNFLDIAALALSHSGYRWGWLEHRIERTDRMICSQLVDQAYLLAGVHLFDDGRLPQNVTPADLAGLVE